MPTPGATSGSSASRSSETWTKPGPGRPVDRLEHRALDPDPVDLGHRDHTDAGLPDERALGSVERPHAEQGRRAPGRPRAAARPGCAKASPASAERGSERHAVDVPGRAGLGRVEVAVRVDPDDAAGLPGRGAEAGERPERDRVVAAEDERERPVGDDVVARAPRAARTPRGSPAGSARARSRPRAPPAAGPRRSRGRRPDSRTT